MPSYKGLLSSKLPNIGTTIFTTMSKLAHEQNAINLSQGFPNFDISTELTDLVTQALNKGYNQYAPMPGLMSLRERIAQKTYNLHGANYNPETEVTVTAGATQAIYAAIAAVVKEEDEVIIFTPAYDCYEPAIRLNGGKPVFVQLHYPDYKIDWEQVKKLVNQKTKMIIINTPHNPTGTVLSANDMLSLEKITANTDIIVLSDEVYEHIVFDGLAHQSSAKYTGLAERSFIVASFGKTFHATGWKIGYCLAPKELMLEFRKAHQFIVFSVSTPMQYAISEYLVKEENYLSLADFYQQKRDYFTELIVNHKLSFIKAKGTYFQLINYSKVSEKNDTDFAIELTKNNKLASIPVSVFYHQQLDEKVLRFCFAKNSETIEKAAAILNSL